MSVPRRDEAAEDIQVLLEAGRGLLHAGMAEAALREFDAAYDIAIEWQAEASPDALNALVQCGYWQAAGRVRNGDWKSAEAKTYELLRLTITGATELTADDYCAIYYARGRCYLDFGWFDDAIACFDWALEHDPAHMRALRDRVRAGRGGDWRSAHAGAVAAVAVLPESLELRAELAWALLGAQRIVEAEAEARDILKNSPVGRPTAHVLLARILAAQDRRDEAVECCDQALELNPADQAATELRSRLLGSAASNSAATSAEFPALATEQRPEPDARDGLGQHANDSDAAEGQESPDQSERVANLLKAAADYLANEEFARARHAYESAAVIDPGNMRALYGQLECLRLEPDYAEASDRARRALDAHPDDWALHYELARLLSAQGKFRDAEDYYKSARDRYGEDVDKLGDSEAPAGEIDICVALAAALCAQHRYAEAERTVDELLRKYPKDYTLRGEQAWIALDSGKPEEAERYFTGLHEIASAEFNKMISKEGPRPEKPTSEFRKKEAEFAKASYCLGYVALAKGNYGQARSYLKESTERAENVSAYKLSYAWAIAASDNAWDSIEDDNGKALQDAVDICRSITINASSQLAETCLGVLYFKLGKYGDSKDHLQRALAINETPSAHADLGSFYLRRGHLKPAEDELREAVSLDPEHVFARCELGELLLEEGRIAEALHEFRMAESAQGTLPAAAAIGVSRCHLDQGKLGDAEKALRAGIKVVTESDLWRLRVALAHVLIRRGQEEGSGSSFFEEAHLQALEAIRLKATEADAHYRAGVAAILRGADGKNQFASRRKWYKKAKKHLTRCLFWDAEQFEARRLLDKVTAALGEERRNLFGPVVLFGLATLSFAGMALGIATDMVRADPMPTAFVGILASLGLVFLVFAFYNGRVEKISIGKLLEMQFTPGKDDVPFGSAGSAFTGIDRLDLPPQPFWRAPGRY